MGMNQETFDSLPERAIPADQIATAKDSALRELLQAKMAEMETTGEVIRLDDEEIAMVRAFRQFKKTLVPRKTPASIAELEQALNHGDDVHLSPCGVVSVLETFTWKTAPVEGIVVPSADEQILVQRP